MLSDVFWQHGLVRRTMIIKLYGKDAIMSHNSDYTNQVEDMFNAVGYDVVQLILENSEKQKN